MGVFKMSVQGFRCQPLPLILAVKQSAMLLDAVNWSRFQHQIRIRRESGSSQWAAVKFEPV